VLDLDLFKNDRVNSTDFINTNYTKPFIQPSVGFGSKRFEFILTGRVGLLLYGNKDYQFSDADHRNGAEQFFEDKNGSFVFEPGVTVRAGAKWGKVQLQFVNTSFDFDAPLTDDDDLVLGNQFSVGALLYINK